MSAALQSDPCRRMKRTMVVSILTDDKHIRNCPRCISMKGKGAAQNIKLVIWTSCMQLAFSSLGSMKDNSGPNCLKAVRMVRNILEFGQNWKRDMVADLWCKFAWMDSRSWKRDSKTSVLNSLRTIHTVWRPCDLYSCFGWGFVHDKIWSNYSFEKDEGKCTACVYPSNCPNQNPELIEKKQNLFSWMGFIVALFVTEYQTTFAIFHPSFSVICSVFLLSLHRWLSSVLKTCHHVVGKRLLWFGLVSHTEVWPARIWPIKQSFGAR